MMMITSNDIDLIYFMVKPINWLHLGQHGREDHPDQSTVSRVGKVGYLSSTNREFLAFLFQGTGRPDLKNKCRRRADFLYSSSFLRHNKSFMWSMEHSRLKNSYIIIKTLPHRL